MSQLRIPIPGLAGFSSGAFGEVRTGLGKGRICFEPKAFREALPYCRKPCELSTCRPSMSLAELSRRLWKEAAKSKISEHSALPVPAAAAIEDSVSDLTVSESSELGRKNRIAGLEEPTDPRHWAVAGVLVATGTAALAGVALPTSEPYPGSTEATKMP